MLINTGNISRKVLSKVLRSFDKNFERLQKRTVVGLPVPDVEDLIDPIDLSDLFVSRENMTEHLLVLEQLREVNPTWYQVIVFSTVYDLDNNTIGELLGQKPELISKWKSRGRAWLRKRYKEQYPNG